MKYKLIFLIVLIYLSLFTISSLAQEPKIMGTWKGYTKDSFFTELISNEVYVTYGKAVFKINNPTSFNISVNLSTFNAIVNKHSGSITKSIEYYMLQNVSYSNNMTDTNLTCYGNMTVPWNTNITIPNCSEVVTGWHWNNYTREEWKKFTNYIFKANNQYIIQIIATWSPFLGFNSREWMPQIIVENISLLQDKWAWWNASFTKCKNITLADTRTINRTFEPVKVNLTGLTKQEDDDDVRIVSASCQNGGSEIPRDVISNTSTSAYTVFLANYTTTDAEHVYSVYYDYAGASAPSYSTTLTMTLSTIDAKVNVTDNYYVQWGEEADGDCEVLDLHYWIPTETDKGLTHFDLVYGAGNVKCNFTQAFNGKVMTSFIINSTATGRNEIIECYDKNFFCLANFTSITASMRLFPVYPTTANTIMYWTEPDTWTDGTTADFNSKAFISNSSNYMVGVVNITNITNNGFFATDNTGAFTQSYLTNPYLNVTNFAIYFLFNMHEVAGNTVGNNTIEQLNNPLTVTLGSEESQPGGVGAINMYFNGTANANKTYTYGESINITGTSNASETVYLYKNNVLMGSGTGSISIVSTYLNFSNATYTIKVNSTSNTTGLTYYILVNKATPTIHLALNGTEGNVTYTYPQAVNATGWVSVPSENTGNLYKNDSFISTIFSNSTLNLDFEYWNDSTTPTNWSKYVICGSISNNTVEVHNGTFSAFITLSGCTAPITDYISLNSSEFLYGGNNISFHIKSAHVQSRYDLGFWVDNIRYPIITSGNPSESEWEIINITNSSFNGKIVKIYINSTTAHSDYGAGIYLDNIYTYITEEQNKLGVGIYNYSFNFSNENYTSAGVWYYANVTQGTANLNIYLNGSQSNQSSYYPNSTVNFTATTNISTVYVQIWRNGTLLANTTGSATSIIKVGVGYWNYSAKVVNTTNFTAPSMSSLWWNVSKSSTTTTIYINGSSSNTTGYLYEIYNITAASNATEGSALVKLSMNATGYGTNFTSGALSVSNISNITQVGVLRINATYDGDANYSSSTATSLYLTMKNASISIERPSGTSKWLLNTSSCTPFPGGCYQTGNFTPLNQTTTQWFYRINNTGAEIINITLEKNTSLNGCIDYYITNNSANLFNPSATFTYNQSDTTAINVYTNLAVGGSVNFWTWVVFTSCTPGISTNVNDIFRANITGV